MHKIGKIDLEILEAEILRYSPENGILIILVNFQIHYVNGNEHAVKKMHISLQSYPFNPQTIGSKITSWVLGDGPLEEEYLTGDMYLIAFPGLCEEIGRGVCDVLSKSFAIPDGITQVESGVSSINSAFNEFQNDMLNQATADNDPEVVGRVEDMATNLNEIDPKIIMDSGKEFIRDKT